MEQAPTRSQGRRWLRWGQLLLLGVVLGLLQLLLLAQVAGLKQASTFLFLLVAMSTLLYLLIPALAGFLVAHQSGNTTSGVGSGCLVGGFGLLVIAVAITLASALTPAPPPCQPGIQGACEHGLGSAAVAAFVGETIIGILFFEGLCSLLGSLVGGWIGGVLGKRRARGTE